MGIQFSGIASGIDTGSIVESFVYAERSSIRSMEEQKSDYNNQLSNMRTLNSKMVSLQKTMEGLSEIGDFLSYSAKLGNEDAVSVTASGDATPGIFDLKVTQLASAERDYSKEFADKELAGTAGEGALTITVGTGDAVQVDILATDSLEDIVEKINASEANVNAGLLYTGDQYRLQISGTDTGVDNAISFGQTGTVDLQLTEYIAAKDATMTVDGYTVTSADNTFEDVIPGVTINAKEVTADAFQMKIEADNEEIEETLTGFVDSYNEIIKLIQKDDTSSSTMRSLQLQFGMQIASEIGDVGGTFRALSEIGISTDNDGTLKLDSSDLEEAIARDTRGVAKLFAGSDDDTVQGMGSILDGFLEQYVNSVDGVLSAQESGIEKMISRLEDSILQEEDRITRYEDGLVAQFTAMEITMNQLNSQMTSMTSLGL